MTKILQLQEWRLDDSGDRAPGTIDITVNEQSTPKHGESVQRDYGLWCPRHLKTSSGQGSAFLGVEECTPPCPNMYFKKDDLDFAKSFIGIISIVCLCATLFTFLTFLIDVKRFRYPERPIIFYSICYSIVSLVYFIGFLLGNNAACYKADAKLGFGESVVLGSQNKGCTVLFMLLYFSTMAGTVWWVILTITWFLAAGQKWSCEAIEKKSMWFHAVAWGIPGLLTVMLLAMNKVEGDNISGVCFVGLYDLDTSRYFVLLPLCLCVLVGLSLLLAGIISLNHVRQVIQHDERNQEKLKKFMIRIGVFSGLYLVPLVTLLGCYVYEQVYRSTWEITWLLDHCQEYHIPCPYQVKTFARPELSLFLLKYVTTLIVGISAVFWVGSKKTCSEWANFFNRTRKRDPVSESRRVLQESCEFFLKHNSTVRHKKKHYKSSSHKLKVLSKSMGTSTGVKANHGTSAVAITNHDFLGQETTMELKDVSEMPDVKLTEYAVGSQEAIGDSQMGNPLQALVGCENPVGQIEKDTKAGNSSKVSSVCGSVQPTEESDTLKPSLAEEHPLQDSLSHLPTFAQSSSRKSSVQLSLQPTSGSRKDLDLGNNASDA
ncbi:frizzled-6 isoform X2 [Ambystoma mexicanum]|uniref:frizzled-6 isoform X2 n=1 Tax=Ambystoma mexicanum TaxID=8296 RepID=UPI0037E824ED